jgi:hypothetical protein
MSHGHSEHSHPAITQPELRRVAVEAGCDPRTIVRYLRSSPVHSTALGRIERALSSCGYDRLVKPPATRSRDSTPPPPDSHR